jgi:hypothetical protein
MRSADHLYIMDQLFVFKIQMVDPTVQNDFHINI